MHLKAEFDHEIDGRNKHRLAFDEISLHLFLKELGFRLDSMAKTDVAAVRAAFERATGRTVSPPRPAPTWAPVWI